jgi:hypothetical protein
MEQTNGNSTRQYTDDNGERHEALIVFYREACKDLKHAGHYDFASYV